MDTERELREGSSEGKRINKRGEEAIKHEKECGIAAGY